LVQENLVLLQKAIDLIENLTDHVYRNNSRLLFNSGVGKHIRHVLDFYGAFLHSADGKIDYDCRSHVPELESDRLAATAKIQEIMSALLQIESVEPKRWSKNDDNGGRDIKERYSLSSVGRELQFLASHTVHHFAIIAFILKSQDIEPPPRFGVAPSTLLHWQADDAPEA
jgi:uncharacterized damage-inducible protein DinB